MDIYIYIWVLTVKQGYMYLILLVPSASAQLTKRNWKIENTGPQFNLLVRRRILLKSWMRGILLAYTLESKYLFKLSFKWSYERTRGFFTWLPNTDFSCCVRLFMFISFLHLIFLSLLLWVGWPNICDFFWFWLASWFIFKSNALFQEVIVFTLFCVF